MTRPERHPENTMRSVIREINSDLNSAILALRLDDDPITVAEQHILAAEKHAETLERMLNESEALFYRTPSFSTDGVMHRAVPDPTTSNDTDTSVANALRLDHTEDDYA